MTMLRTRKRHMLVGITILILLVAASVGFGGGCAGEDTSTEDTSTEDTSTEDVETLSAQEFYEGKTIEFIVPYGAGGGTDTYARLVAPYMGKYTGATVTVRNMPGAGGVKAYNYTYNVAEQNGLTIAITATSALVLGQLFEQEGVEYDFRNFNWLGRLSYPEAVVYVAAEGSPYESFQDLVDAERLSAPATSPESSGGMGISLLAHALDFPVEKLTMVSGYSSGKELMLSVVQGENDFSAQTSGTVKEFADAGQVKPIVTLGSERSPDFPDTPALYELAEIPADRKWPMEAYLGIAELRRGVITGPDLPEDRVKFLRDALQSALGDEELLQEMEAVGRTIRPMGGEEMQKVLLEKVGGLSNEEIDAFRTIVLNKYY